MGTESYMAPEVRDAKRFYPLGNHYSPEKVDIFTVGITFFMLVFGSIPFRVAERDDELYTHIFNS